MTVPVKLKDSASADFVQFSSTEENYLAYQAGLHLASGDSSDVGSLAFNIHGVVNTIGSVVDTSYDSAVGTGGDGSFLSFTTTTTPIRQTKGTITPAGSNNRLPVMQRDSDGQRVIREMNDSDVSALLDRVGSRIFTSDYPGSYKLSTSTPSGGYSTVLSNVTTDTRTDGTSIQYNLYRRTSMTPPTKVLPFSIKRSSGDTGTYQGLQLMTDDQVKYSIGTRLQNKIAGTDNSVGSYKIYSASAGTPTNNGLSGTWQSKGTATDTRQDIVDANYTRGRVSTYSRLRESTYSAAYNRTRSSSYASTNDVTRTTTYSATYSLPRTSSFTTNGFIGNYIGNYQRTTSAVYTRSRLATLDYAGDYVGNFVGNYSRLLGFTGNYSGVGGNFLRDSTRVSTYGRTSTNTFVGNYNRSVTYLGNYTGNFLGQYTRDSQRVPAVDFTGNFVGNYSRNFLRTRNSNYQRNTLIDSTRTSTRDSQRTDIGNFTGDFTGNYSRNFSGAFTRNSLDEMAYVTVYSRGTVKAGDITYYTGNYLGTNQYVRHSVTATGTSSAYYYSKVSLDYISSGDIFWQVPIADGDNINTKIFRVYWGTSVLPSPGQVAFARAYYDSNADGNVLTSGFNLTYAQYELITGYYDPDTASTVVPTYEAFMTASLLDFHTMLSKITRIKDDADGYEYEKGDFQALDGDGGLDGQLDNALYSVRRRTLTSYVGNFSGNFLGNYSRNFARDFLRNSTRTSTTNFLGNFIGDFLGNFVGDFTGDYQRSFIGEYSRNYQRTRVTVYTGLDGFTNNYLGNYIGNFSRNFTTTFIGNYSRNFVGNYIGNYARNFIGNYNRTFTGNYAGATIGATNSTIETYTLYVRTA